MTIPMKWNWPIKRPNFITAATWQGPDDDLVLQISFPNEFGNNQSLSFTTRGNEPGEICLPTSSNLDDLGPRARDILVAHVRMACMISGQAVPGSKEFEETYTQLMSNNFQTALGTVNITNVAIVNDIYVDLTFKKGTGPTKIIRVDHGELNTYTFAPDTQLLVIPGAIEKQFPNHVHNGLLGTVLTQNQKDEIAAYVLSLQPWI